MDTQALLDQQVDTLKLATEDWRETYKDLPIYLLLNPHRGVDGLHPLHPDRLWEQDERRRRVVERPDFDWDPEVCPILIQLAEARRNLPFEQMDLIYARAIEEAGSVNGAYVCGLIASSVSLENLAAHLKHSLRLPGVDGLYPYFEPLRLERLVATAGPDLLADWFGPVSSWLWVSADGAPLIWTRQATSMRDRAGPLAPAAAAAQQRIVDLGRCLSAWKDVAGQLPPQAALLADAQLQQAQEQGLVELVDQIYFALLSLNVKSGWHMHPEARPVLAAVREAPGTLVETIEALSDEKRRSLGL